MMDNTALKKFKNLCLGKSISQRTKRNERQVLQRVPEHMSQKRRLEILSHLKSKTLKSKTISRISQKDVIIHFESRDQISRQERLAQLPTFQVLKMKRQLSRNADRRNNKDR